MEFVSTSSGTKTKDNIFVDKVKIASATVKYDTKEDWQTYSDNISIHLTLDIGRDFEPNMYIGGSFKTDEVSGKIEGWSTAFKIKMFFDSIGMPIRLDKGKNPQSSRLPADVDQLLVGKEFLRLTYLSTKVKRDGNQLWKDWQETRPAEGQGSNIADFKAKFKESVSKNYVKDFSAPNEADTSEPWDDDDQFQGMPT